MGAGEGKKEGAQCERLPLSTASSLQAWTAGQDHRMQLPGTLWSPQPTMSPTALSHNIGQDSVGLEQMPRVWGRETSETLKETLELHCPANSYKPHFTDEQPEAQRGSVTRSRTKGQSVCSLSSDPVIGDLCTSMAQLSVPSPILHWE